MCNDGVACRGTTASSETAGVATEKQLVVVWKEVKLSQQLEVKAGILKDWNIDRNRTQTIGSQQKYGIVFSSGYSFTPTS